MRLLNLNSPLLRLKRLLSVLDGVMLFILLLIVFVSVLTMYSAASDMPERFYAHLRNMLLCFFVMFAFAYIPPKVLMQVAIPLYILGVILLLAVAFFGQTKLGAKRWINLGITIQPSELLKIAVPIMLAYYFHIMGEVRGARAWQVFSFATLILLIPFVLIARQPDLGTALLVVFAGASVIFFAGLYWKIVAGLTGFLAVVMTSMLNPVISSLFLKPYQQKRIAVLLDPKADPRGAGFHVLQSETAIGSGGWLGKGWLQGTQTHLQFIPERSTDFLIAVFSEEFGLIGILLLLLLYLLLIFRGLSIAYNASTRFDRLLASSISMVLFTYIFVNMGMVAGILPVVGVPLPFMSYGGTALITLGIACGILMSIRHNRVI